jgi:hypothetical protein
MVKDESTSNGGFVFGAKEDKYLQLTGESYNV